MYQRPLATLVALTMSVIGGVAHADRPPAPVKVKVIGLNDFHGNLNSPGTFGLNTTIPAAQRPPVGGVDFVGAWVEKLKAENPNNVVVGAGDFIGASPLVSALFNDEPTVETMNRAGLEFNAVGNHEFDDGAAELLRLQNGGCKFVGGSVDVGSCRGAEVGTPVPFEGASFHWLSANVIDLSTRKTLLAPYGTKKFRVVPKRNRRDDDDDDKFVRVAFIGMTLKGTPGIVTPTGVAGLEFLDEADTVNALVPKLRRRGIEAIVVLVHQGGFQNGSGNANDINGCIGDLKNADGSDSDIRKIVARLDNAVDLVISGHTHAAYNCSANTVDVTSSGGAAVANPRPTGLPNKVGRLVPVTSASAFGRVLSDIDVTIDPRSRNIIAVDATNVLVDRTDVDAQSRVAADPEIKNIVDGYNALTAPLANQVIGSITVDLPNTPNADGEMLAGRLIADAQLQATQPAGLGGAVMAFMNPGGVRNPGFAFAGPPYDEITYGEAFTVQPFGNSLVTLTLTAQQLKDLLEQQFVGCLGQGTQRVLQVSNGVRYSYSAAAPACAKIQDVSFTPTDLVGATPVVTGPTEQIVQAGVVLNPAKTYRVTVNNFLATGGDGFTVLVGGTNALGGAQDIDALVSYFSDFSSGTPYDPAATNLGTPRITRLP